MRSLLSPKSNWQAFSELLLLLTRRRQLTFEMARRELSDRYAGQFFGLFWTIGHPIVLMLVYVFIFGYVFRVKIGGTAALPLDYTAYLLSGLIPWLAFQDAMSKASAVIVSNANLVKQVIFPIEVLPVKGVLATLFTQCILLAGLVGYVLLTQRALAWTYLLLPVLIGVQALGMIGVSYILSAIGTYFRDTKDFVQIFNVVGMYLIPTFYLPEFVPGIFRPLLYLNPFSHMIWCYQDLLYFGRFEHPWAWPVWIAFSLAVFVIGYRLFRKLSGMFGNVL
jgi:lipopolysaccharide transport system permease protein